MSVKSVKYFVTALLLSFASLGVQAFQEPPRPFEACADQMPYGVPGIRKQHVAFICRKAYAVIYDVNAKTPIFASYVLTPEHAVGCLARSNAFAVDESLSSEQAVTPKELAKSGYDKGHMVNDGDMRWDIDAERESFIMTNMALQLPRFNRGIWKKLEDLTRGWAISRQHPILVNVGSIYGDRSLMYNGKTVPDAFYKVLVDTVTAESQVYVIKHEASKADIDVFITSIADAQQQAGVTFKLPANVTYTHWDRKLKTNREAKSISCAYKPKS